MPEKRNQLNLYDHSDLSKNFEIDHNNGVIEVRVPDSSNMTVSGKATFDAGSTCVVRDNQGVLCGVGGTSMLHTPMNVNDLGNDQYQLVDQFAVNYSGASFYVDGDLDNKISGGSDITIPVGAPNSVGTYIDPEHYVLSIDANGFKPYFNSQPLANADNVTWALSYVDTPGDPNTIRSTILSGSFSMNGSVYKLSVNGGMEWPVNGWDANREGYWIATTGAPSGIPLGSHIAADIADFVGFYFDPASLELSAFCQSEDSLESIFDTIDSSISTLTSNLASEVTRASDAETVLDNKFDTEIAALTATDAANHATILADIATEVTRAQQAEASLQVSIDNEQARAEAEEQSISATVAALAVTEAANDATHQTAIDNEIARATAAETAIQADEDANEQTAADALVAAQTTLQNNIDNTNTNLSNQSTNAQSVEAGLQVQIDHILSNAVPTTLDSLTEIVEHFSAEDNNFQTLLELLLVRVVNAESVLNCLLDPDFDSLDPLLQSLYDSYVSATATPASECNGNWVYGTISGQDGWTSLTNDGAQPDSFGGVSQVAGDEATRGNSIVGVVPNGDGTEEAGQVYEGNNAWWLKRGYQSAGSGTPATPNVEPAGQDSGNASADGVPRDSFKYSTVFRAHQSFDNSSVALVAGNQTNTDRASNYVKIVNSENGIAVQVYIHDGNAGWGGSFTTIVDGLAWDQWHTFEASMISVGGVDTWTYTVDGTEVNTSVGYFNSVRTASGYPYENSTRLKFQPVHSNYDDTYQGFYFDNVSVESWSSANQEGTLSKYCADFEISA